MSPAPAEPMILPQQAIRINFLFLKTELIQLKLRKQDFYQELVLYLFYCQQKRIIVFMVKKVF
jgi:hypothetical protein